MEEDAVQHGLKIEAEPDRSEENALKVIEPETIIPQQPLIKQRKTSDEPQKTKIKNLDVSEHQPTFSKIQLKKAETVKRVWDEPKSEVVQLKHHEFEVVPQREVEELATKVLMTQAIEEIKASLTKTKRVKKIKAKKFSKDVSTKEKPEQEIGEKSLNQPESPKQEPEEPARQEDDERTQPSLDSPPKIATQKKEHQKVVERTTEEPVEPDCPEENALKVIEPETIIPQQPLIKLRKTSDEHQKTKIQKIDVSEHKPIFSKIQLKKAETVKRVWDEPKPEDVQLKHHEFEVAPQREVEELASKVLMTQAIEEIKASQTKTKRVKKIKAKKFSEDAPNKETQEEEIGEKSLNQPESQKQEPEEPARQEGEERPQKSLDSPPKIATQKKKHSKVVERTTEEPALGQVKLRKSSVVKREWDTPELQQVSLKKHQLEQKPLEEAVRFHLNFICPNKNG